MKTQGHEITFFQKGFQLIVSYILHFNAADKVREPKMLQCGMSLIGLEFYVILSFIEYCHLNLSASLLYIFDLNMKKIPN